MPAADYIERIDFETEAAASGPLRRDHHGATAPKTIKHDGAPRRAVHDRVADQGDRFHGRMEREQIALVAGARERVGAGVVPNVATATTIPSELNVVEIDDRA